MLMLTNEEIAERAHNLDRDWCQANDRIVSLPWDELPDWLRINASNATAFYRSDPDAGADAFHALWLADKVDNGWVLGEIKDREARPPTHPCLMPFADLPTEERERAELFRAAILEGCSL